jgi:hypothetical protein
VRTGAARGSGRRGARVRRRPHDRGRSGGGLHRVVPGGLAGDRQADGDAVELRGRHQPSGRRTPVRGRGAGARGDPHGAGGVPSPVRAS